MPVVAANTALSTLQAPVFASDTTILVKSGEGPRFPSPDQNVDQYFVVTLRNGAAREIMHCTRRINDTLTVVRAQEGTVAQSFPSGSSVENLITAGTIESVVKTATDAERVATTASTAAASAVAQIGDAVRKSITALQTVLGSISLATLILRRLSAIPAQGGYMDFEKSANSNLVGDTVRVETNGNLFRIYETGGNARGVQVDLTLAPNGATGRLWHSGNFNPLSQQLDYLLMRRGADRQGGAIQLEASPNGSTTGGVTIDTSENFLRVFEAGGTEHRGFAIPLKEMAVGVGTRFWHNGNFNPDDLFAHGLRMKPVDGTNQGGGISLMSGPVGSGISGDIRIDSYGNQIRFFETAGSLRGAYIDLGQSSNGVASQIWTTTNFNPQAIINRLDAIDVVNAGQQASIENLAGQIASLNATLTSFANTITNINDRVAALEARPS